MSNVEPLYNERVLFATRVPPQANACLQEAAASPQAVRAEALLNKAAHLSPKLLAVDVARYKFYFYRGQLAEAESIVLASLEKAAGQGGFEADWRLAAGPLGDREHPESPARYYLYALKALAFIRLRQDNAEDSTAILDALRMLDPDDLVGASVIEELLRGIEED